MCKAGVNWWLSCAMLFGLVITAPAVNAFEYFGSLQQQLIADGLNETMVRSLYARPEVKFETRSISVYFVHHESKVDYDQYSHPSQIRRARQYMHHHRDAFSAVETQYGVHKEVIGRSVKMKAVLSQVEQVAATDSTVLIEGDVRQLDTTVPNGPEHQPHWELLVFVRGLGPQRSVLTLVESILHQSDPRDLSADP